MTIPETTFKIYLYSLMWKYKFVNRSKDPDLVWKKVGKKSFRRQDVRAIKVNHVSATPSIFVAQFLQKRPIVFRFALAVDSHNGVSNKPNLFLQKIILASFNEAGIKSVFFCE